MKKLLIISGFTLFIGGIFIAGSNGNYQLSFPMIGVGALFMVVGIEKK